MDRNYRIKLAENRKALAEIDTMSALLLDPKALDREWYFVARDRFQLFLREIKKKFFVENMVPPQGPVSR